MSLCDVCIHVWVYVWCVTVCVYACVCGFVCMKYAHACLHLYAYM